MKLILLAATAMLAVPAIAQTTTAPTTPPTGGTEMQTPTTPAPTTADPAQTMDPATTPPPGTPAPNTQAPMNQPPMTDSSGGMTTQTQTTPAPTTGGMAPADGSTPMGGYQPAQPALSGAAQPGVTPTFQAAPSPSEAYPAPAPLASYPICKKGQYDKCRQRGGR